MKVTVLAEMDLKIPAQAVFYQPEMMDELLLDFGLSEPMEGGGRRCVLRDSDTLEDICPIKIIHAAEGEDVDMALDLRREIRRLRAHIVGLGHQVTTLKKASEEQHRHNAMATAELSDDTFRAWLTVRELRDEIGILKGEDVDSPREDD